MLLIDENNYKYVPVSFNCGLKEKGICYLVEDHFINTYMQECVNDTSSTYIFDFDNIRYIRDRGFENFFEYIKNMKCKFILANIEHESPLDRAIKNDIGKKMYETKTRGEKTNYVVGIRFEEDIGICIDRIVKQYFSKLITEKCISTGPEYLFSSGVYSNMQISIKKLFEDTVNFRYLIYLLYMQIRIRKYDGLIATSKNGVAIASVLGDLLGCQVLYLNIGQMFEEAKDSYVRISPGGKYIHIYDMICLGSEAKVLNALVSAQGGTIVQAVGCVCLPDLEIVKEKNKSSVMNNVWCLIGQNDLTSKYDISLYRM